MKNILITVFFLFIPVNSYAATLEVGAGRAYSTIQAAVNAAGAGDTVLVYPGTYNEGVFVPDGKSGTSTSPIIIKALYPARKPLDGGPYADVPSNRSVINATGKAAGIYNDCYCSSSQVGNIIIDGFYITGGTLAAIHFINDHDIWIKNNMAVNNGYNQGENYGDYITEWTPNTLIQNNYAEFSVASFVSSTGLYGIDGANTIMEYNECNINVGVSNSGRCLYVHHDSPNSIFQYNYLHLHNGADTQYARLRDTTGFTITNNFIWSTAFQEMMVVHENTNAGLIENHNISRNTWVYEQGAGGNSSALGLGFQNSDQVNYNIFYSGISDADSYAMDGGWTQYAGSNNTVNGNVWWRWKALLDPLLTGFTETNSLNTNPNVNTTTGCAASVDNNVYGANLDLSNIPYRRCDGTLYPMASKFGFTADKTIPNPPTALSVK